MALIATEQPAAAPDRAATRSGRAPRGGLAAYAVRRSVTGLGTLAFVLVFNFFLFRLLPGDPIALYTRGRNTDREQIAALRRALNKPIGEQFLNYVKNPFSSGVDSRSEEHTSELQSPVHLVCRLLLEK